MLQQTKNTSTYGKLKTYYWLGALLSPNSENTFTEEIRQDLILKKINWNILFQICDSQLIIPSVYLALIRRQLLSFVPVKYLEHFEKVYLLNRKRNENILKQINEITPLLNKNGIEPVFIKGSGNLLDNLYCDIGERFLIDIDFLVPDSQFLSTTKLLEANGYKSLSPDWPGATEWTKHYPRLENPEYSTTVEVHRLLADPPFHKYFNYDFIKDKRHRPAGKNFGCYVFSDEYKAIHNFIHSQLNDRGHYRTNSSFRQMYDFMLLLSKPGVQQELQKFKRYKQKLRCYKRITEEIFLLPHKRRWFPDISYLIFQFSFNFMLRSEKWRGIVYSKDNFIRPIMYYLRAVSKALVERDYRKRHIKRLLHKYSPSVLYLRK